MRGIAGIKLKSGCWMRVGILASVALTVALAGSVAALPPGFLVDTVFNSADFSHLKPGGGSQLSYVTTIEALPDGRVLIGSSDLRAFLWDPVADVTGTGHGILPLPFIDYQGGNYGEAGIAGCVAAPDYAETGHFFISYQQEVPPYSGTTPSDRRLKIERFTADLTNKNAIVPGSGLVIFDIADANVQSQIHFSCGLTYGPDGKLYFSLGDDAISSNSQSLNSLRGKILRMNDDGTAPADNPFYQEGGGVRNFVYAMGLRNPYRMYHDLERGKIFNTDTGQGAWEEVNVLSAGKNYGWPTVEGPLAENSGVTPPANYKDPLFSYPHGSGPLQGDAIVAVEGYYGSNFPASYRGDLFTTDWGFALIQTGSAGEIFHLDLDAAGNLLSADTFYTYPGEQFGASDMTVLPDGSLLVAMAAYVLTDIRRIHYTTPDNPPTISISADPDEGIAPLQVHFHADVTDEGAPAVVWSFPDGSQLSGLDPVKSFNAGTHLVTATATDAFNSVATDTVTVRVFEPFEDATVSGSLLDVSSGSALPVAGHIHILLPDGLTIAPGTNANGYDIPTSGQFTVAPGTLQAASDYLLARVSSPGLAPRDLILTSTAPQISETVYLSSRAIGGALTRSDTQARAGGVDLFIYSQLGGQPTPYRIFGGRDAVAPAAPAGFPYGVLSDAAGQFYMPITASDSGRTFVLKTNLESRLPGFVAEPLTLTLQPAGMLTPAFIDLIAVTGGADCENVAVSPPYNTTFAEVQGIFDTHCIGCHGVVAPYRNLSLSDGFAYSDLVNQLSEEIPGKYRVAKEAQPSLANSYLFEKINCGVPSYGGAMPLTGSITQDERDSIARWILGGAKGDTLRATALASVTTALSPAVVQFRGGAEGGTLPYTWFWDFDDGTFGSDPNPSHVLIVTQGSRNFLTYLEVYDPDFNLIGSDTASVQVSAPAVDPQNAPPIARLPAQGSIAVGDTITLDASTSTDADGHIVAYAWDLNNDTIDEETTLEPRLDHRFTQTGLRQIRLTVTDDKNAQSTIITTFAVGQALPSGVWMLY
ncbi:hypothetical protein BH09SUM1_BH09SUM1_11480 [soil metagenome]